MAHEMTLSWKSKDSIAQLTKEPTNILFYRHENLGHDRVLRIRVVLSPCLAHVFKKSLMIPKM